VVAVPEDDPRLGALALDLMQRSRIIEMRDDSVELAALKRAAERPLPTLPRDDDRQREAILIVQLLRDRDHFRRALALVEKLIGFDKAA
jgi:hypothetical protein